MGFLTAAEIYSMSMEQQKLSHEARLRLVQTLNVLPSATFESIIFALDPPAGCVPDTSAPQGMRSTALLKWVESSLGPGLIELETIVSQSFESRSELSVLLEQIVAVRPELTDLPDAQRQKVEVLQELSQDLKEYLGPPKNEMREAGSRYDLRGAKFAGGFADTAKGSQVDNKDTDDISPEKPQPADQANVSTSIGVWDKADRIAVMTAGGAALGAAIAQLPGAILGLLIAAGYGYYIGFVQPKSAQNPPA